MIVNQNAKPGSELENQVVTIKMWKVMLTNFRLLHFRSATLSINIHFLCKII